MPTDRRHLLRSPMMIYAATSDGHAGILPAGTSLRYVETFPEGFDRYRIHVNVERFPLDLEEAEPADLVEPLSAFGPAAADRASLRALLRSLGITKADLAGLLDGYDEPGPDNS